MSWLGPLAPRRHPFSHANRTSAGRGDAGEWGTASFKKQVNVFHSAEELSNVAEALPVAQGKMACVNPSSIPAIASEVEASVPHSPASPRPARVCSVRAGDRERGARGPGPISHTTVDFLATRSTVEAPVCHFGCGRARSVYRRRRARSRRQLSVTRARADPESVRGDREMRDGSSPPTCIRRG
jgi:hypothetical protein